MCEVELQYLQLLNFNMAVQTTFKEVLQFEVRTCKINLWCISSLVDFIDVESNLQLVMVALVMNASNATFNFNWNCKDYKTASLDMLQGIKCSTNFKNKINWDWIEIDWISLGKCTFSPSIGKTWFDVFKIWINIQIGLHHHYNFNSSIMNGWMVTFPQKNLVEPMGKWSLWQNPS
jgi:hypothetical protein